MLEGDFARVFLFDALPVNLGLQRSEHGQQDAIASASAVACPVVRFILEGIGGQLARFLEGFGVSRRLRQPVVMPFAVDPHGRGRFLDLARFRIDRKKGPLLRVSN